MIAPSTNVGGDQLFGPVVVWVHPHQGHLTTLVEAAQKLMPLVDDSPECPYTFIHMSNTMLHVPLSDNGHIGAMMDGVHTVNACGWLHQLQAWKLLQHSNSIVFPEGLNGEPEALQFCFQELPLWNATSLDEPTQDLSMIEVVRSGMGSETASSTKVPPPLWLLNLCGTSMVLNLHLQGALEQL